MRPLTRLALALLASATLMAWPGAATAATPCTFGAADGATISFLGGGGSGFRDFGGRAALARGAFELDAEYRSRSFDERDETLSTFAAALAFRAEAGRLRLCPTVGLSRKTIESLTRWLVPAGVVLAASFAVSDALTLTPFVEPAVVWSHSGFADQRRRSLDPALEAGATLSTTRFHLGASWGRLFLEGDRSGWSAFVGLSLPAR